MPNDYPRSHRVADFIQRELSQLIRTELKDPDISPMLTLASVDVSRDLSVARVYFSVLDSAERIPTQKALERASGYLRRHLAANMKTRSVPELRFYYDDSLEQGARMSALIAEAVASNTTDDPDNPADNADDADAPDASGSAGHADGARS